jgi:proteasome assembly chaperone (PAC2) family protein
MNTILAQLFYEYFLVNFPKRVFIKKTNVIQANKTYEEYFQKQNRTEKIRDGIY